MPPEFNCKLYWFENDQSPAETDELTESKAHNYAKNRSADVQGKVEVLQYGNAIATYRAGELSR